VDDVQVEETVLRLQKGDVLQLTVKSEGVDAATIKNIQAQYQGVLDAMHGAGAVKVIVFGISEDDEIKTEIRKDS
jgi:hypothetical protein